LLIQQRSLSLPTARVLIFGRSKDEDSIAQSLEILRNLQTVEGAGAIRALPDEHDDAAGGY
jgi:hypothetical protein